MIAELIFDAGLALLVLCVAGWTIAVGQTFAAVVSFVVFGLLVTLAWVRLSAVDVALTEAAIGSGVTGAVLIAAAARLRPTEARAEAEQPSARMRIAAAILAGLVTLGLAGLVLFPAEPAPSLAALAVAPLASLDIGNPVTAVLMAYRSLDTLLEKVVLLLALVGVWSLAKDRFWGGVPRDPGTGRPDGALALLARLLPPVGIVFGVYILWVGAAAPGGVFQGGTILAAMWLLTMIAGVERPPATGRRWLRLSAIAGPAVFLVVGLAGFMLPGGFLSYPAGFAKPVIIAIEVVVLLSIAVILGLLVLGPPARDPEP